MLEQEVKQLIIDVLQLEDISVADIDSAAPLFVEGLGLDSIDALELAVVVDRSYGVKIQGQEDGRAAFASLTALADYIRLHGTRSP